jgi:hypothetical protein
MVVFRALVRRWNLLVLSILVLFAGPLLYQWLQRGGLVARTLDQVVVAVLVGVVFLLLVPESIEHLGWWALLLIFAGYLVPGILERAVKSAAVTFHMASLAAALLGLILHALLDGAGLAGSEHMAGSSLALAIVLHRLGVGLIVWLLVQPLYGRRGALSVLLLVAAATVAGYFLSNQVLPLAGAESFQVVQALIIGAIVHSLLHRGHGEKTHHHD